MSGKLTKSRGGKSNALAIAPLCRRDSTNIVHEETEVQLANESCCCDSQNIVIISFCVVCL